MLVAGPAEFISIPSDAHYTSTTAKRNKRYFLFSLVTKLPLFWPSLASPVLLPCRCVRHESVQRAERLPLPSVQLPGAPDPALRHRGWSERRLPGSERSGARPGRHRRRRARGSQIQPDAAVHPHGERRQMEGHCRDYSIDTVWGLRQLALANYGKHGTITTITLTTMGSNERTDRAGPGCLLRRVVYSELCTVCRCTVHQGLL